jgi:aspartate/methionine/tyrosine aminotransferase
MSTALPQFLTWMKEKYDLSVQRDVVNLAISGVTTDFANRWQNDVLTNRAADILARSTESNQFGLESLKQAIRTAFNIPASHEIVTTLGASGGIRLVAENLLAGRANAEFIVESPVYEPIRAIPERLGAKVVPVLRLDALAPVAPLVTEKTVAVFVTNPHNPTGHWLTHDELGGLARELETIGSNALVVVDETFSDIGPHPGTSAAAAHPRIVTISSLSKSHGLPALRCGWVTADPSVVPNLAEDAVLFQNIGCKVAEVISAMAIEEIDAFRQAARAHVERNRALVAKWLAGMADAGVIEPQHAPSGCVVFPRLRNLHSSLKLVEQLESSHGVLVAPGIFFGEEYDHHIRIGFGGDQDQLQRGLTRLATGLLALARGTQIRKEPMI